MGKKNIEASFYTKEPLGTDIIQLVGWSGNNWDNIAYFPKKYQIGLVTKGEGEFFVGENVYPIKAGQFFLIHPGKVNSGKPNESIGWAVDSIAIKQEVVDSLFDANTKISFPDFVVEDEKLKSIFFKTFALLNKYEQSLENEGKLYLLLEDLIKCKAYIEQHDLAKDITNQSITRAIDFITTNYKQNFSLDELAQHAYMSKFHLLRIFKTETGLTPYAYQIQLKLNEARRLIFQDKSLTEVAYELGFADQAHFTNTFKKFANGANPSDLLKTAISYNFEE
jgi:AraC-like DNA-binding protein